MVMNAKGKWPKVGQFLSFLLQAAQASWTCPTKSGVGVRSTGNCSVYFLQCNPTLMKGSVCNSSIYDVFGRKSQNYVFGIFSKFQH